MVVLISRVKPEAMAFTGPGTDRWPIPIYNKKILTRCVIHNGPAINFISTIDIYVKLVIARGKFFLKKNLF
jgi:hypothetical protein